MAFFVVVWGVMDIRSSRREAFDEARRSAETISMALRGGLQTEIRRGAGRRVRLQEIIDSVVTVGDIRMVRIDAGTWSLKAIRKGEKINADEYSPVGASDEGFTLSGDRFLLWKSLALANCPRQPDKEAACPADASEQRLLYFTGEGQRLLIGISADNYHARLQEATWRTVLTLATALFAIVVLSTAWGVSIKSRSLKAELALSKANSERLEELGLAAAGIAHETKNPLGLIRGLAQKIQQDQTVQTRTRDAAEQILDEVDTAVERIAGFLSYAKPRPLSPSALPAQAFVEKITSLMASDFTARNIRFITQRDDIRIKADEDALTQIVVNLLLNSLAASSTESGEVSLTLKTSQRQEASLTVADKGAGIPASIFKDIFKPYVSGRHDGFGLGLAITKRLVDEAGWRIDVVSAEGSGTTVTISGMRIAEREAA